MAIAFKHRYKSDSLIGTGAVKFRHYAVAEPLPRLATPQNVSADGTTVSWDEVENATSYEVRADGVSIGTTDGGVSKTYTLNISNSFPSSFPLTVKINGVTESEGGTSSTSIIFNSGDVITIHCDSHEAPGEVPITINGVNYSASQTIELKDVDITVELKRDGEITDRTITINT